MPGPDPHAAWTAEGSNGRPVASWEVFLVASRTARERRAMRLLRNLARDGRLNPWCREPVPTLRRADAQLRSESRRKKAARERRPARGRSGALTGAELRAHRRAARLSREALAKRAGVGRHAVQNWGQRPCLCVAEARLVACEPSGCRKSPLIDAAGRFWTVSVTMRRTARGGRCPRKVRRHDGTDGGARMLCGAFAPAARAASMRNTSTAAAVTELPVLRQPKVEPLRIGRGSCDSRRVATEILVGQGPRLAVASSGPSTVAPRTRRKGSPEPADSRDKLSTFAGDPEPLRGPGLPPRPALGSSAGRTVFVRAGSAPSGIRCAEPVPLPRAAGGPVDDTLPIAPRRSLLGISVVP